VDGLAGQALTVGGPWALIALAVVMMLRGDIVPRRSLDDALRNVERWEAAHSRSEEGRHEALRQNAEMLEAVHATNHVLAALPLPSGREVNHAPVDHVPTAPQG